jgi:hypothetical protein
MASADGVLMMRRHRVAVTPQGRPTVRELRPSPFHPTELEKVVTQKLKAPVIRVSEPEAATEPVASAIEPPRESRWDRALSKIPLLRHLRRHPPSDGTEPR